MIKRKDSKTVEACFFGGFLLRSGEHCLSEADGRTKQLWLLLEYLLMHKEKMIGSFELQNVLWKENEIVNPSNALKNLVYRLRHLLSEAGFSQESPYILSKRGGYCWNPQIKCFSDVEEFDEWYRQGFDEQNGPEERMKALENAAELYRGDFLEGKIYEEWAVFFTEQYRRRFFECAEKLCQYYEQTGRFEQEENLCEKARRIDPFAEEMQLRFLKALAEQQKFSLAIAEYQKITELYYQELGMQPSEKFRARYREITEHVDYAKSDLITIKEDLRETLNEEGAFFCDYDAFKHIYRLEARSLERSGQSVFVCLFTLNPGPENTFSKQNRERAMSQLKEALTGCLRRGDVIARYSATQYVAMLPTLTEENSVFVTKRIRQKFAGLCSRKKIELEIQALPLNSAEE